MSENFFRIFFYWRHANKIMIHFYMRARASSSSHLCDSPPIRHIVVMFVLSALTFGTYEYVHCTTFGRVCVYKMPNRTLNIILILKFIDLWPEGFE